MPDYNLQWFRTLFPHIGTGMIYLNHAAMSPLSTRVVQAVTDYLHRRSETEVEFYQPVIRTLVETKRLIGTLLQTSPDRIAMTDNTSNGLNILAAGFDWKSGDRILVPDIEFPANVYPFLNLKRHGVEVDFLPVRNGHIGIEEIEPALTARTRLFSVSHVQFLHGIKVDLAAIGDLCKRKGILFCVDAIQSVGAVPIDVKAMNIDFLATGGHKWLMAPEGIGFIYVSEECQSRIRQAHVGWTSITDFFTDLLRYRLDLDPSARRYENGLVNVAVLMGLHASLQILLDAG
ncbi:MAG: aminotransferase class V-fold PLP-dependent enzyme, partial [Bacteroidota bacterium]